MVKKMISKINNEIAAEVRKFEKFGNTESHERKMAEIDGMASMLELVTGNEYIITEKGMVKK